MRFIVLVAVEFFIALHSASRNKGCSLDHEHGLLPSSHDMLSLNTLFLSGHAL